VKPVVKQLSLEDTRRLRAAEGWYESGDIVSACKELGQISAEARSNHAVLSLRNSIDAWLKAAEAGPRSAGQTAEAKRILLVAQVHFPKDYRVHFHLACCCAQLGELKEAEQWLKKAIVIDEKKVQKLAVDNPDLKPLWDSMDGTIWKRE